RDSRSSRTPSSRRSNISAGAVDRLARTHKRSPMNRSIRIAILGAVGAALAFPVLAQTVKVTPLGGFDGEFCAQDRALVFEDPSGTRVLYDPGRTVMGGADPRLGKIDIVLVTHTHGDHLRSAHTKAIRAGTSASPDLSVSDIPNS